MASVRTWFAEHPPSAWTQCLELAVRALNWVLLLLGLAVTAWSVVTVVQIKHEPISPPSPPAPPLPPSPPLLSTANSAAALGLSAAPAQQQLAGSLSNVPWFIYAFGALGLATTVTAGTALLGIRLRSPGCLSGHVFFMCLLLTGQACAAVAFFMDHAWEKRLPDIDEKLKEFLTARLQVRHLLQLFSCTASGTACSGLAVQLHSSPKAYECIGCSERLQRAHSA